MATLTLTGNTIRLEGALDAQGVTALWRRLALPEGGGEVVIDGAGVTYCGGAGQALVLELRRLTEAAGRTARLEGFSEQVTALLNGVNVKSLVTVDGYVHKQSMALQLGQWAVRLLHGAGLQLSYTGALFYNLWKTLLHPRSVRWRDWILIFENAGVDALPVVALVAFLIGLILTFLSAVMMAMFGAQVYVPSLLGIAYLRELGVLVAAIMFTGRSGSAFAAELGTMKVNQEVDALTTMGLDPMRFLAVPRVMIAAISMPLLTMFAIFAGMFGSLLVMLSMNVPIQVFYEQAISLARMDYLVVTLVKAVVFGFLIGMVGCMHGLETGQGADAVGKSTTASVVSGIVLIVVADGLFALMNYAMGAS